MPRVICRSLALSVEAEGHDRRLSHRQSIWSVFNYLNYLFSILEYGTKLWFRKQQAAVYFHRKQLLLIVLSDCRCVEIVKMLPAKERPGTSIR